MSAMRGRTIGDGRGWEANWSGARQKRCARETIGTRARSWRVRVALSFYGVEYAYARVNLLADEQRGLSEMGQVPRLDWSDAAGERHSLTQSLAILELLHEAASAPGRSLLPLGPVPRARAREIAEVAGGVALW